MTAPSKEELLQAVVNCSVPVTMTKLDLSGLGLIDFPIQITLLTQLKHLDLSNNQFSSLPDQFESLQSLNIAFFSNNRFNLFPSVLGKCSALEMVAFRNNEMVDIPPDALSTSLRWLILTSNLLENLPETIGNCARLQKLMLAGNRLRALPQSFPKLVNLQLLRIPGNQLTELPAHLLELPRLAWLAWADNPFCEYSIRETPQPAKLPEIDWENVLLGEVLGQGASGVIYSATWKGQNMAVKLFKGTISSDGSPESEMKTNIVAGEHTSFVRVLGKLTGHPSTQGLGLELLGDGYKVLGDPPSMESCTRDVFSTALEPSMVMNVLKGVCSACVHLHNLGISHGDIYAHNTLVSTNNVKLTDFGASTIYGGFTTAKEAEYVERIEVAAFGWMVEDLAKIMDGSKDLVDKLLDIRDNCVVESVLSRPTFKEVLAFLENL